MDEVEEDNTSIISMKHDEMDKRKASPNELDEEDTRRHFLDRKTIFEYFFHYGKPMEVLASKVERNDQHKELISKCMDSLLKAYVEGVDSSSLKSFDKSANQLFHTTEFIKACLDAFREDLNKRPLLPVTMNIYENEKQAIKRMQILIQDSYLKHVLQDELGCLPITRVVLSVLFCYWSDNAFYTKVTSEFEIDQKKASPNTSGEDTLHPKRIQHEFDSSYYVDIYFADGGYYYTRPHIHEKKTILKYFFEDEKAVEHLADIVERNDQLKNLITKCMDSLCKVYVEGVDSDRVQSFDESAKDLFSRPAFIQICVDTFFEEFDDFNELILDIWIYKDENQPPSERMKSLMCDVSDDYLKEFLKDERGSVLITRFVLSVLFGYWSDGAFYTAFTSELDYVGSHIDKHKEPKICRVEKVAGVCCPASVEGLKELLRSKHPEDEANFMCAEIDGKRKQYDYRLPCKGMVITSYNFVLRDNKFYMPLIALSKEDKQLVTSSCSI